mmetsp:Transcript_176156/g.564795  ORF Transcript_176156/g.564795 Transcript_176156/m.564795 type:complete len:214 (+) Transcript_176156:613-1254(+)
MIGGEDQRRGPNRTLGLDVGPGLDQGLRHAQMTFVVGLEQRRVPQCVLPLQVCSGLYEIDRFVRVSNMCRIPQLFSERLAVHRRSFCRRGGRSGLGRARVAETEQVEVAEDLWGLVDRCCGKQDSDSEAQDEDDLGTGRGRHPLAVHAIGICWHLVLKECVIFCPVWDRHPIVTMRANLIIFGAADTFSATPHHRRLLGVRIVSKRLGLPLPS